MPTSGRKKRSKRGAPALRANVAELRAVAHPLRLRLLELFAEAPRTTKQVADLLEQPPTRLYHHVNALERAGLLTLEETRPNRGVVEKWYSASRRYASFPSKDPSDRSVSGLASTVLDQSRNEVADALTDLRDGETKPLVVRAIVVGPRQRHEEVRNRISAFLNELQEYAAESERIKGPRKAKRDADSSRRFALTISFAPVGAVPESAEEQEAASAKPAKTSRTATTRKRKG